MRYLVLTLWVLLYSMPLSAQLYKWVDEHGKIQYSDRPPPSDNTQNEQLKIRSAPKPISIADSAVSDEETGEPGTLADQRLEYDKRRQERLQKASEQKALAAENQQKCVDAKSKLRVFLESPRLRLPDGKGGIAYVDDKIRQQKIDKTNEAIKTYCK